jgi:hypothetical protein
MFWQTEKFLKPIAFFRLTGNPKETDDGNRSLTIARKGFELNDHRQSRWHIPVSPSKGPEKSALKGTKHLVNTSGCLNLWKTMLSQSR